MINHVQKHGILTLDVRSVSTGDPMKQISLRIDEKLDADTDICFSEDLKTAAITLYDSYSMSDQLCPYAYLYLVDLESGEMKLLQEGRMRTYSMQFLGNQLAVFRGDGFFLTTMQEKTVYHYVARNHHWMELYDVEAGTRKWSHEEFVFPKLFGKSMVQQTVYNTGSGKKVSFKLTVVKRMTSVELPDGSFIAGGKSLTLKPEIGPSDTTNKKLTWKITGGSGAAYATISQKGVLKTGKVTAPKTVEITVTAQDGSACTDTCTVTVYPATTKVMIWSNGANVTGQTITAAGTEISLSAACTPISAAKKYTWKSSNTKYATVDEYGNVLLGEAVGKTVTITAAAEGSGQKAVVKIKITAR